jgi:acyl-homoserine-lactone acylase
MPGLGDSSRWIRAAVGASAIATLGAVLLAAGPDAGDEILWDRYGVPHIRAANAERLAWGFGYAQMQNHANLLLRLYGQARGRAAEYWGSEYTGSDSMVRIVGIPARARTWYGRQTPAFKRYLDGFIAGMNAYAKEHPDAVADSLKVVLPLTAIDVLAHSQRMINLTFVVGSIEGDVSQWRRQGGTGQRTTRDPARFASTDASSADLTPGSNAWAIAPSRSASGKAMLVANPHLPWADLFTWIEAQLTSPEVDVYGATLVGSPIITIGFNDNVAWTHTVNTHDGVDLFELTVAPDGKTYRLDGAARGFGVSSDTMKIKHRDGTVSSVPLTIRESIHGPVVAEKAGKALALRIVGLDRPFAAEEWWDMGRAKSLVEMERALRRLQIPMFNVIAADRGGHIMYLFNGLVPRRPRGAWSDWLGIVAGDSSSLAWSQMLGYDELPKVVDPPNGWVQNANDPPWTSTIPQTIDRTKFPAWVAPSGMALRPQRSARLLAGDEKLTFDEMIRRKHDTRMELADRLLDDLIPLARERGNDAAKRAAAVLERWDRNADAESRGAVLFASFWREIVRRGGGPVFAVAWDAARPLETPDGFADATRALRAIEAAAADVEKRFGALDVAWGDAYRLQRDAVNLAANGGGGELGIFRVVNYGRPDSTTSRASAVGGDSFFFAAEFTIPLRARTLLGYGNASQPGSPHRTDQLPLFARKEMRPVWRSVAEIEANLEGRHRY